MEISIVIPCLNEEATIERCITKANHYLSENQLDGEVIVADNGSTDTSKVIVKAAGARLVEVAEKGYGAALRGGIEAARGAFVIMGDGDDSYDFSDLGAFIQKLREGYDLVMGNRFKGGVAQGAMPL